MYDLIEYQPKRPPWNKGKLVGQNLPLKPQHIWGIRIHLQMAENIRELALFNLAIDSKLRGAIWCNSASAISVKEDGYRAEHK